MIVEIYITKNSCGSKNCGIVLLQQGSYKKALAKCLDSTVSFNDLLMSALDKLKYPVTVHLFTNCKGFDVDSAVMRASFYGQHQILNQPKKGLEVIEWLKFVAYEIALNKGVDEFLLKEAMGDALR